MKHDRHDLPLPTPRSTRRTGRRRSPFYLSLLGATCLTSFASGAAFAQTQNLNSNNGTNGTSATNSSQTPTSGTSGGPIQVLWDTPRTYSDAGFQSIWFSALSNGGSGGNAYQTGTKDGVPIYSTIGGAAGAGGSAAFALEAPVTMYSGVQYGPSTSSGVRGVLAQSTGSHPGAGVSGLWGGNADAANLIVRADASLAINWGAAQINPSFVLGAVSKAGNGTDENQANAIVSGGSGGAAGVVTINTLGATISFDQANTPTSRAGSFDPLAALPPLGSGPFKGSSYLVGAGIFASSWGGSAGAGNGTGSSGGAGGSTQGVTVGLVDTNVSITSSGLDAGGSGVAAALTPAILAQTYGGRGGDGAIGSNTQNQGGNGGQGGSAGTVEVTVAGDKLSTLSTAALQSPAVAVLSFGGGGGNGAVYNHLGFSGAGGSGGSGGAGGSLDVSFGALTAIRTNLASSPGIYALSIGGNGGDGALYGGGLIGDGGAGGAGGAGGRIDVSLAGSHIPTDNIITQGAASPGIWAASIGGVGGTGGHSGDPLSADGGSGGNGGGTGMVQVVTNANSGITTYGSKSPGIVAQSISGHAGSGGSSSSLSGNPGGAGNGGSTGTMNVISQGSISTRGDQSPGIVAQNQSGGGGSGGDSYVVLYGQGGSGGSAGAVGATSVTVAGGIETAGASSPGVVVQSLSGGGGYGGFGDGIIAVGGSGGSAQAAGTITATVSGSILTIGTDSQGAIIQSVGGGGGDATDLPPSLITGIGGTGGTGGNGGAITATARGSIQTEADRSIGLLVQSIGAGGGTAGGGSGIVAIGGSGGAGGNGGNVTLTSNGTVAAEGASAHGIVAQSVGGGGGTGGGTTITIVSIGGSGSTTGNGGDVTLGIGGAVTVSGSGAIGAIAQSVGGGGGVGADATGALAIGGSGSAGGAGGTVAVTLASTVSTVSDNGAGVVAQSVGGGGGVAGSATSYSAEIGLSIGGQGGSGGNGGSSTVSSSAGANVVTYGSSAVGIIAQSVGKGGGTGGGGYSIVGGVGFGASLAVGGSGGAAGDGGAATVNLSGTRIVTGLATQGATDPANAPNLAVLTPLPVDSAGVVAQSVGGGGGAGGSATAKSYVADIPNPFDPVAGSIGFSGSFAVGGAGGAAGNGGTATVNVAGGSHILTYGNGSFGVEAQSVGGGGGNGGDSSSSSATYGLKDVSTLSGRKNYNLDLTYSNGGNGSGGGYGGAANVTLGGTNFVQDAVGTPASTIQTLGDYAFAVAAQSIGGGGGNAGIGAGSTQNATSSSSAITMGLTMGAQGAIGGAGNHVQVTQFSDAAIATSGDTAYGILAQSVGGGGGTSAGGSFQAGLPSIDTVNKVLGGGVVTPPLAGSLISKFNVKVGADGGAGGNGGTVEVVSNGRITTTGEAATGVLAQSVGGGGGVAGSSGSGASSDNPYLPTSIADGLLDAKKLGDNALLSYILAFKKAVENDETKWATVSAYLPSLNFNLSFGATGGSGGIGGAVNVTLDDATISTAGDYAKAVVAQSVGGGGGAGGAAAAGGSKGIGNFLKLQFDVSMGGDGGSGSHGGAVRIATGDTTITTQGYAASGILGQSVGGGGGLAGSAQFNASSALSLGLLDGGKGGVGADGGIVTLAQSGTGATSITTAGDLAHGVVLQSVGGGGGIAEQGYGIGASIDAAPLGGFTASLAAGGAIGGSGGTVQTDTTAPPLFHIATSGAGAFGFIAQSVGGGGGIAAQNVGLAGTYTLGGAIEGATANGGAVNVAFADGSVIRTTGADSFGLFAQSVGGGGGVAGVPGGAARFSALVQGSFSGAAETNGNGGAVTITTGNTLIATSGASAHGIFAQSVGAGGGIMSSSDGTTLLSGTTGGAGSNGAGGSITINQSGAVIATGANAFGILAQTAGQDNQKNVDYPISGAVTINVNGTVSGGAGNGAGIRIVTDNGQNNVNIGATGVVRANSGLAIFASGYGWNHVYNSGIVEGSYELGTVLYQGLFQNQAGGQLILQGTLKGDLVNAGLIAPSAANGAARIVVDGNFEQTSTGSFRPNVSFATGRADRLEITGSATLDGRIGFTLGSIRPNRSLVVLTADGGITGKLTPDNGPGLFSFQLQQTGNALSVSAAGANFGGASFGLNAQQAAVARGLQDIWNSGGGTFDTLFVALQGLAAGGGYADALSRLSPGVALASAARGRDNVQDFSNNLMSCPVFENDSALVGETSCTWARVGGRLTSQTASGGMAGFNNSLMNYQVGTQWEIAPDWFLGGSLAYQQSWLSGTDGRVSTTGNAGAIGLALKRQAGPWLLAASLGASQGWYDTKRLIAIPGFTNVAYGSSNVLSGQGRLRAAYSFVFQDWYVRPTADLDIIHVRTPGYSETGAGALGLTYDTASQWTAAFSPTVEVGGRVNLRNGYVLRPYGSVGASFFSNSEWTATARLQGGLGAGGFTTSIATDPVVARLGVGVQLFAQDRLDVRLTYDGAFSEHTVSNALSLRAAMRF